MQIVSFAVRYSLRFAWAATCASCMACGGTGLSGSIGKHLDLNYDSVTLTLTEGATGGLDVVYTSAAGSVADITVDSADPELGDLVLVQDQAFLDRVHLTRSPSVKGSFPPVASGVFRLSKHNFAVTRASVAGSFRFVFTEGSVLEGQFDGAAAVVLHF